MSYLKSARPTSKHPPPSLLTVFHLQCGWLFGMPSLLCGDESWGGVSFRSYSHACYNDTVHDHRSQARPLKTQHNSSTDKRLQPWLPVCLPTFDIAGYRTLNVPENTVFSNHIGFKDANLILLNLLLLFLSSIGVKPAKFPSPQANTIVYLWQLRPKHFCVCACMCVYLCNCVCIRGCVHSGWRRGVSITLSKV